MMSSSISCTTVLSSSSCANVAGVWSRVWEEDPLLSADEECRDTTTKVLWTQSPSSGIYIDLRLPIGSPGRGDDKGDANDIVFVKNPAAIRAFGPLALSMQTLDLQTKREIFTKLTKIKSFAGVLKCHQGDVTSGTALEKDIVLLECCKNNKAPLQLCTCIWERMIDYQPPSGGADVGVCASYSEQQTDGSLYIRETGQDASYAEGWYRLPFTFEGPFFAMELVFEEIRSKNKNNDKDNDENTSHHRHRQGFWVRAGSSFAYAVGRPAADDLVKQHTGKNLMELMEERIIDEEEILNALGQYVGLYGEIQSGKWNIFHSTNPSLVGCRLVGTDLMIRTNTDMCCSTVHKSADTACVGDFVKQVICGDDNVLIRNWRVVELHGCSIPLCSDL